jgi:dTDP-4-dehydrorhamnose reductase
VKIALFGRDGQVATEVRRRVPSDVSLTVLDRTQADFLNPDQIADVTRTLDVDAIINAVAYTQVDQAEDDAERARIINADAVAALAKGAAATNTPVVHISTDYVFSGEGTKPWVPTDAVDPQCVYGATKLQGEQALTATGVPHAILRTSWVFSAHRINFAKTMLKLGDSHTRLTIVSDQIGGPTPSADIADACLTLARGLADGATGGTYHFSGTQDTSWAGFAREIFDQTGQTVDVVDIPTDEFPRPAKRPLNSRLDCSTLEADFGISRPDWREGLKTVLHELST